MGLAFGSALGRHVSPDFQIWSCIEKEFTPKIIHRAKNSSDLNPCWKNFSGLCDKRWFFCAQNVTSSSGKRLLNGHLMLKEEFNTLAPLGSKYLYTRYRTYLYTECFRGVPSGFALNNRKFCLCF